MTWYLYLKVKLHAKCVGIDSCGFVIGHASSTQNSCVALCLELIEMQCDAHEPVTSLSPSETDFGKVENTSSLLPLSGCSTEYFFMVLEASVVLSLRPDQWQHRSTEVLNVLRRACQHFYSRKDKIMAMPYAGLEVLQALLGDLERHAGATLEVNTGVWSKPLHSEFGLENHSVSSSTEAINAGTAQNSDIHAWMDQAYMETPTPKTQKFPYTPISGSQSNFDSSWKV